MRFCFDHQLILALTKYYYYYYYFSRPLSFLLEGREFNFRNYLLFSQPASQQAHPIIAKLLKIITVLFPQTTATRRRALFCACGEFMFKPSKTSSHFLQIRSRRQNFKRLRFILLWIPFFVVSWEFLHKCLTLTSGRPPPLSLLVSYVYFESSQHKSCEISNKRLNLAIFLKEAVVQSGKNVRFLFTIPENLPPAAEILQALNLDASSNEGRVITDAMNNQLSNVRFFTETLPSNVADLCHHQNVIRKEVVKFPEFNYFIILNDGSRGPFLSTQANKRNENYSQLHSSQQLPFSNVPPWVAPFLFRMTKYEDVALVGPISSCELDTHLQSWFIMFDTRVLGTALLHMQASCVQEMQWTDAIQISEVGLSLSVLNLGYSISSIFPSFDRFTSHHRTALQHGVSEVREKMNDCRNPLVPIANGVGGLEATPSKMVFAKYGGEVWRQGMLSAAYKQSVISETARIIGTNKATEECHRNTAPQKDQRSRSWHA
jgi:hypothetical protein